MITWIILGYLAASTLASLIFYAACRAAARADRVLQQTDTDSRLPQSELGTKRTKRVQAQKWALHT